MNKQNKDLLDLTEFTNCPVCGEIIKDGVTTCPNCGEKIKKPDTSKHV